MLSLTRLLGRRIPAEFGLITLRDHTATGYDNQYRFCIAESAEGMVADREPLLMADVRTGAASAG
jgi:hypothetical protein